MPDVFISALLGVNAINTIYSVDVTGLCLATLTAEARCLGFCLMAQEAFGVGQAFVAALTLPAC